MLKWARPLAMLALLFATAAAGESLSDPTRPPGGPVQKQTEPPAPAPALRVDFIIASQGRRLARVNGSWVSEGEAVAGATVVRIESASVVVRRGGQYSTLSLAQDLGKRN